ncbi:MAG TPA: carboxypeptidase-like regulatory domain-containing protein [Terriglobales bacterium]|nr:carboxypeptidase-like regulatory domain-containing protein [Terriglobales bacterium]
MQKKNLWVVLTIGLMIASFSASIWAADVTARIRGTVTDPSGAVVPGAELTATNVQTGVAYTAKAQSNGNYELLNLPVGTYNLAATAPGFQAFSASGIKLNIDQQYVQDVKLAVGSTGEKVEVVANQVQVDTTSIQLSNVVESKQIVDLPLIGRNWTQLELISPGVQAASDRFGTFSANGSQAQQSSYLINGTDTNDLPLNTALYIPSPDALSQFNLVSSSLNPEYARNSGAIVSASIKNGTNQYHGDVFEFYRDTFLNNHNFFQLTAPKFHQNLFGGTFGGPVLHDKLFFFLSYQGNRASQPQTVANNTVFTSAELAGNWALSPTGSAVNFWNKPDPKTPTDLKSGKSNPIPGSLVAKVGCAPGSTWGDCFQPGGFGTPIVASIPTSAFNPIATALVQKYVPLANAANNQFLFNPTQQTIQDQGIARVDANVTASDQLLGIMVFQHAPSSRTLPFTGATLPGFGDQNKSEVRQYTASWTHLFGSATLNELRLGYSRLNFDAVEPQNPVLPSSVGFQINPQNSKSAGLPLMSVTGMFTLGFSNNGPQPRVDQTYQVTDNFSKIVGNHSYKFGYEGRRFNVDNPFFGNNNGNYSFGGTGGFSTLNAGLDFLLGNPDTYGQGAGGVINANAYEHYLYAQDQWKFRDNLTITYGAGWQVDTPFHNRQFKGEGTNCFIPGQTSTIFPTAPTGLNYPGDKGCNDASGATTAWKDIGPRVGFAYAPNFGFLSGGDSRKLSIRGGYGIYFNRTEEETSLQNLGAPPFGLGSAGAADFTVAPNVSGTPSFANPYVDIDTGQSFTNKFPFTFPSPGQPVDFTPFEPISISLYSPHFRIPYSENFNLTIERQLPSNIVARMSYVGALGRHEQITYEGNPITQAGHDACLASSTCSSAKNRINQSVLFPTHTAFAPGDQIASVGTIDTIGSSNYHSLQLSATKGYTHGLLFQASYTWSHAIDNGSSFENSGFGGANRGYNQFVPGLNIGDSGFDVRHRFVISPVYDIPSWKSLPGLHWLPDVVGKGWEISGIMTFATGFPVDIRTSSGSLSLFCTSNFQFYACPDVPNQVAPIRFEDPRVGKNFWFDPTSFQTEAIGTFGNTHRNPLHGPGINSTDAAIFKNIYFWPGNESRYIQLRLESYNVFNHTNFYNPASVNNISNSITSGTFGRVTSAAPGRQTQLAAKIYF